MEIKKARGFNTVAVHGGELKIPEFGNVTTPVFENSTFVYPNYNQSAYLDHTSNLPYIYSRWGNPTLQALELKFAELENTKYALSFSSGMSAIVSTVLSICRKGDRILSISDLYGQTASFFENDAREIGIDSDFVSVENLNSGNFSANGYSMIYLESITNPTLKVSDIVKTAKIAGETDTPVVVDATFASPYNQKPLDLGASVSIHSGTKYLAGHSDIILGMMAAKEGFFQPIHEKRKVLGGTPDALQAFLAARGLKTLGLRMQKHNRNAMEIFKFLKQERKVRKVFYPGDPDSPFYSTAQKNLSGYGGMISFELHGGIEAARLFIKHLSIPSAAPSLGGVESLITLPVDTSHSTLLPEKRRSMGIEDGLVRFSTGIEDHEDLIADVQKALEALT